MAGSLLRAVGEVAAPGAAGAAGAAWRLHALVIGRLLRPHPRPQQASPAAPGGDVAALCRMWAAYVIGAAAALICGILAAPAAGPLTLLGAVGIATAGAASAARLSLESWQRRGGQGGWREWRRAGSSAWLPPCPADALAMTGGRWSRRAVVPVAVLAALAPVVAAAAVSPSAAVGLASEILRALLPGGAATDATAWTHALGVLVSTLAALTGPMLAWHTLAGTVATAHEGKVLGQRWHQTWAPIRVIVGFALLAPLPSGLCFGHLTLAAAAGWSSSVATEIAAGFAAEVLAVDGGHGTPSPAAAASVAQAVGGADLARRVLTAELCAGVRDRLAHASERPVVGSAPIGGAAVGGAQVWDWGAGCGSVSVPAASSSDSLTATFQRARIDAVVAVVRGLRDSGLPDRMADGSIGDSGVAWPDGPAGPTLSGVGAGYDAAVQSASAAFLRQRDADGRAAVVAAIRSREWPYLGAMWGTIGQAWAATTALAAEAQGYTAPDPKALYSLWRADPHNEVATALRRLETALTAEDRAAGGADLATLAAVGGEGDLLARMTAPLTRPLTNAMISLAKTDSADPLGDIVGSGHVVVGASEVTIAVVVPAVAAALKNWFADALGAGGVWDWASGWARVIIGAAYVGGWLQGYLLPITPAIGTLWATIGWALTPVEASIAVPILAFLFIRMDGQELIDSVQRPGMIVAASVVLRPISIVLGLCSTYYLLPLGARLVGALLPTAWLGAQAGHTVSIGGVLGAYVLLAVIEYQVAARLCAAVTEVPDRVLRWWGASADDTGERGHTGAAAGAVAAAGAGLAASAARQAGGGGGGGGGNRPGPASKVRGGGLGIRPVTGSGGGGTESGGWYRQAGGLDGLSAGQQAAAREAYAEWSAENPGPASKYSLSDYVDYAQKRQAQRDGQ